MRLAISTVLNCLSAAFAPVLGAQSAPIPMPTGTFAEYLARANAGDTTLDFQSLRLSYTITAAYDPYGDRDGDRLDSLYAALDRDSIAVAAKWADSVLADNPVMPRAQVAAAYVAHLQNDSTRAAHHLWMLRGLIGSIYDSGSGTEVSPFVVIAVYEEYALARFMKLERAGKQSLGKCGAHACDFVGFKDPATGRDTTLAFDVSIPTTYLDRQFKQ